MFNIPMDITTYTRVQDGITSRANQCLNLYLLKRDKYEFWWILQLPAYQHQRGSAGFVITACLLLFWQWWWCCCCCCRRLDHVGQLLLTLTLYFCHPFSVTGGWVNQQGNIGGGKHLEVTDLSLQHVCCYFDNGWWWCYCCCCCCCCCCRRLDHVGQLLLTLTLYFCHPFSVTGGWVNQQHRR